MTEKTAPGASKTSTALALMICLCATDALADGVCQSRQFAAAAGLYKRSLDCESRYVRNTENDPFERSIAACLKRARNAFARSYDKALREAQQTGGACELDSQAAESFRHWNDGKNALVDFILTGWEPRNQRLSVLYSSMLSTFSLAANKILLGESQHAKRPNPARLKAVHLSARNGLIRKLEALQRNAARKGIGYGGPGSSEAADQVDLILGTVITDISSLNRFGLNGTVFAAEATFTDSDVNDSETTPIPNNDPSSAQLIPVPSKVGGYVNLAFSGSPGHSYNAGDTADFYRIELIAGQVISLLIGENPHLADLDVRLFDANGAFIDETFGSGNLERLTAPADGTFYVQVYPYAGASSYVLTVGQPSSPAATGAMLQKEEFVPGEVIVRLKPSSPPASVQGTGTASRMAATLGLALRGGAAEREMLLGLGAASQRQQMFTTLGIDYSQLAPANVQTLSADEQLRRDTIHAAKALRLHKDVASADLNYLRHPLAMPNDPLYPLQWHYSLIDLPRAWDLTTGDSNLTIAVIDTGVLLQHPDLSGQLIAGYDFISDPRSAGDGNGLDADANDPGDGGIAGSDSFHGTHVAGTIAANSNNGVGVAGIAWHSRIMPLRALGVGGGTDYDIIQAIRYAAGLPNDSHTLPAKAADIINMSFGGEGFNFAAQQAVSDARSQGVIIVAAAGNSATNLPSYPAAYDGVISVSAVDFNSDQAPYSDFGSTIDIAAPGGDTSRDSNGDGYGDGVLSTLATASGGEVEFDYRFYQGTSMAAPHVAGVAALMKSVDPGLTPDGFDDLLASGALTLDLGVAGRDDNFGYGLIDAWAAVAAAQAVNGGGTGTANPILRASPSAINFGVSLSHLTLEMRNAGGGALSVTPPSDNAAWLTVTPLSIDPSGLGVYQVSADRSALTAGTYSATIIVESSANSFKIPVVLNVGGSSAANTGLQHILLLDPKTLIAQQALSVNPATGLYGYSLSKIPAGEYLIVSGKDLDNDGFLCNGGEACGGYPTIESLEPVTLTRDISSVDFTTGFLQSISVQASAATKADSRIPARGLRRLRYRN